MKPEDRKLVIRDQINHFVDCYFPPCRQSQILTAEKVYLERYSFFDSIVVQVKRADDNTGQATIAQELSNGLHFDALSNTVQYIEDLFADVIMGIVGNVISGQVTGDTAKQLSERIGKIMQDRQSLSINRTDTSISKSKQLEAAVPASKIAGLSSGEFVGLVADDPTSKIELKAFHCEIVNDHDSLKAEESSYQPIPEVRKITPAMVQRNYDQIRQDVQDLRDAEMERITNDPGLRHLVVRK